MSIKFDCLCDKKEITVNDGETVLCYYCGLKFLGKKQDAVIMNGEMFGNTVSEIKDTIKNNGSKTMKLELLNFIKSNENWEELLKEKPYSLTITRDGDFIMFKYSQISSNFNLGLVREARGIIFHEPTWKVVCWPFEKFGNYGEGYTPEIDWSTAQVMEKVDGSLIKIWQHRGVQYISTNGTIDANCANLSVDVACPFDSFGKAVRTLLREHWFYFHPDFTYMFELVGKWNRVVVPYEQDDLIYLGQRNNVTGEEYFVNPGNFTEPKFYNLFTLDDVVNSANVLPFSEEGYVVKDCKGNRIKIKSPAYVAVHHLHNNGVVTLKRLMDFIILGEHVEFLNYYPEYTSDVYTLKDLIYIFHDEVQSLFEQASKCHFETKRDYAMWVLTLEKRIHFIMFMFYDGKVNSKTLLNWMFSLGGEKLLELVQQNP